VLTVCEGHRQSAPPGEAVGLFCPHMNSLAWISHRFTHFVEIFSSRGIPAEEKQKKRPERSQIRPGLLNIKAFLRKPWDVLQVAPEALGLVFALKASILFPSGTQFYPVVVLMPDVDRQ